MARYAEGASVPAERSQQEITAMLRRRGATTVVTGISDDTAMVAFAMCGRQIRFLLPMPDPAYPEFHTTGTGRRRDPASARVAWEAETRRRWRALVLVVKAKLEVSDSGITSFESEWLAYTVLPDGRTVAEHTAAPIAQAYATGQVQDLLPKALDRGEPR